MWHPSLAGVKPFQPPVARATRAIVLICLIVQVLLTLLGTDFANQITLRSGLIPARLSGVTEISDALPAILTLLSSLFLHAGWFHLAMNLFFLGFVGRYVEWIVGPGRFIGLYLAGGIAGGVLQVAAAPESVVPVIGASGAIAAVFAVYAVVFAQRKAAARRIFGIAVPADILNSLWLAAVWIGLQLMTGLVFNDGASGGIAIWTHIGGFVAGLLLARPLSRGARIVPL